MTRLVRITGFLLVAAGAVVSLTWVIKPLRAIWPWFKRLPLAIQVGLGAAALGIVLVFASLLWERFEERDQDKSLQDEL